MSEISDVVQIIRIEFEGMELAMKVGSASLQTMQKAAKFLMGMLFHEKNKGKTNLKKLLMRGGDLEVYSFEEEDLKKVEKLCKKFGILYSLVPKLDDKSNIREIVYHSEASPRIEMVTKRLKHPELTKRQDVDKYVEGMDDKEIEAFSKYVKEEAITNPEIHAGEMDNLITKVGEYAMRKKSASVEDISKDLAIDKDRAENIVEKLHSIGVISKPDKSGAFTTTMEAADFEKKVKRLSDLNLRMRKIAAEKDTNLLDITIAKKLIQNEALDHIVTRVPGTWGDNARYIRIDKKDFMEVHSGKTILTYLDKDKNYSLFDKRGNEIERVKGEKLYGEHYAKVDKSLSDMAKSLRVPVPDKKKVR